MYEVRVVIDEFYGSYAHYIVLTLEDAQALSKFLQVMENYRKEDITITPVKPVSFKEWTDRYYGRDVSSLSLRDT